MKTIVHILFIALSSSIFALADSNDGPLDVTVTKKWNVEYISEGAQFYAVNRIKGESALLMFHRWAATGNRDQIPFYLNQIAEGFLKKAEKNKKIQLEKEGFEKNKIEGDLADGISGL